VSARPRLAIILWLTALLGGGIVIALTRFSADMSAFLPRSPSAAQQVLVEQVKSGVASRLILIGLANAPAPTLAALSQALAKELRSDPAFVLVNNGEELGAAAASSPDGDFLWRNRYLLSPKVTPERFTVAGLHDALASDLDLLNSDLGALVKRSLGADPTGELLTLISTFAGQSQPSHRNGVWFARDGSRALLLVETHAAGFDIASQEEALAQLQSHFAAAQSATPGAAPAQLLMTGPAVFAVHTKAEMKEDISRLSLVATLLVSAILLLTYRSPRILVLALVPVASGALAGIAAVSLGFGFVHGITLGFGVTLIGEAVDYAIYLLTQTAPGSAPEATLPRIWPLLRLGVLISVCGFSAMLFSSFTGFAQLGLFSITGLIVAVVVTRVVLPGLLPKDFATARSAIFAPALLAVTRRARSLRWPLLLALGAAALLLALHRGSFWEDDLTSLSPIPAADQKLDQSLRSDVGAPDVRYLVVATAPDAQQALTVSAQISAMLDGLANDGVIQGFDAPDRYLPSIAAQRARQAALPDAPILRANLDAALADLPFEPDLFAPFLADVGAAKTQKLIDRTALDGTSLALKLDALLLERPTDWTAILSLRGVSDPAHVAASLAALNLPGAVFVDLKAESDRLLQTYRREAVLLAVIGSLVIVALLAVSLRSFRRVALVVAPLAASVLITTAVLTIGSEKLSIFNLMGLLLTVAVGSNYCIFFEHQDWADPNAERMVASLALANLCTVIGFGILSFARLPVLHGIGTTVAIGAFLSLIFSAIVTGSVPGRIARQGGRS
jgi:predicted exporter